MTSILPQIEELQEVTFIHERYAEKLLHLLVSKLLSLDEFTIDVHYHKGRPKGSVIGFDGDDGENVQLELRYVNYKFVLVLHGHGDENFMSTFRYKIFEDSPLYQQIPDKLRKAMDDVTDEYQPITYKP